MRQHVLEMHLQGQDTDAPHLEALRDEYKFPRKRTCDRWIDIFYETGNICPKKATNFAGWEILGDRLEKLTLYRSVFPKATLAECRAHLYNLDPTKDPYSDLQVVWAEGLLGLTRKAASTTAQLVFTPRNLEKR